MIELLNDIPKQAMASKHTTVTVNFLSARRSTNEPDQSNVIALHNVASE